jgi:predicted DNA-binding transcriptional regulator
MVLDDRLMKVREIAESMGISKESVGYICMKNWMRKGFAQDECRAYSQQIKNAPA